MSLIRLSAHDKTWLDLLGAWEAQCAEFGSDVDSFAGPSVAHAARIAAESPPDPNYGIFAFKEDDEFIAIVHLNRAELPKTFGKTLRALWVLLAPRFDFVDQTPEDVARVAAGVVYGVINVATKGDLRSDHLKIHLRNMGDRSFFQGVVEALRRSDMPFNIALRGNWLHIDAVRL